MAEVEPIHATSTEEKTRGGWRSDANVMVTHERVGAFWVGDKGNTAGGRYLATCRVGRKSGSAATVTFLTWVATEMAPMAIDKTMAANRAEDPKRPPTGPSAIDLHELEGAPDVLPHDPKICARQP